LGHVQPDNRDRLSVIIYSRREACHISDAEAAGRIVCHNLSQLMTPVKKSQERRTYRSIVQSSINCELPRAPSASNARLASCHVRVHFSEPPIRWFAAATLGAV
jgi:hypothetical protein